MWSLSFVALLATGAFAQTLNLSGNPSWDNSTRSPFTPIILNASDGSISASFIPYSAALTNLWVPDKNGTVRDIVLGYDDLVEYSLDASHPNFGPIVGRYANRIKNSTFTDPADNVTYHVQANDNNGLDALHGGNYGWSWRTWVVTNVTTSSVILEFYDPPLEGYPATVIGEVTYELLPGGIWDIKIDAVASARTPILLSSHVYWNFDGYLDAPINSTVKDWVLWMPYSTSVPETDTILIPTGPFINVTGTAYDFTTAKPIGWDWNGTLGFSGLGGYGYDTCFVLDESATEVDVKLTVWSPNSGIKLSVTSNQPAIQIYTCGGQTGTELIKTDEGNGIVSQYSCMVIEQEDVIDAINNPEWGIDQWYSPERPYEWHATYTFSVE